MGKRGPLDDTLGPYWNDFNPDTPRERRNTVKKCPHTQFHDISITEFNKPLPNIIVPSVTPHQNHPVFQPETSSLTNETTLRLRDHSEHHYSTGREKASSTSAETAHDIFDSGGLNSEQAAPYIGEATNQTDDHSLRTDDGVNHGTATLGVEQATAKTNFRQPKSTLKSTFENHPSTSLKSRQSSSTPVCQTTKGVLASAIHLGHESTQEVATLSYDMSSRPGAGRRAGRDTGKDNDVETELFTRVLDAVRKAKEYNDESQRLGTEILALEEEIRSKGRSSTEQHRRLDDLYRQKLRNAEAEKKVHDEEDIVNNLAILATMRSTDDTPAPRAGHNAKSSRGKGGGRSTLDNEAIADSPGPTPGDSRVDILKRGKDRGGTGTPQRSSSVASQHRSGTALAKDEAVSSTSTTASTTGDTSATQHKGILAERAGTLVPGVEVFYKFPKGSPDDLGVGIQCVIKKVWAEKKPNIIYDVQDPEPDQNGKINVHKATAKDLYPIPSASETKHLPSFAVNATVYARYPDTDTFYKAKVVRAFSGGKSDGEKGKGGGEYILRFEGEEDDKEQPVERRFVLDAKMKWSA